VSLFAYVLTPAIDALDFLLFFVTPLSAALLIGVPTTVAKITGTGPGTRNYVTEAHGWIGEIHAWLQTFPLFHTPPPQTPSSEEKAEDDWIEYEPDAKQEQEQETETQEIPWDNDPPPPPEMFTYSWACEILHVPDDAPYEHIQAAYRLLAQQHHPDRATNPRDAAEREDTMSRINAAWEIIKKRRQDRA